jgi:hypothetical protein
LLRFFPNTFCMGMYRFILVSISKLLLNTYIYHKSST